jgi:hypothetical protein
MKITYKSPKGVAATTYDALCNINSPKSEEITGLQFTPFAVHNTFYEVPTEKREKGVTGEISTLTGVQVHRWSNLYWEAYKTQSIFN